MPMDSVEVKRVQARGLDDLRPALVDPFGREISYLRVSVTDRCDFRCVYCMAEHMSFLPKADLLTLEELDRLCSAFVDRGVRKLRLTGGEPLVRRGIMTLFRCQSITASTCLVSSTYPRSAVPPMRIPPMLA